MTRRNFVAISAEAAKALMEAATVAGVTQGTLASRAILAAAGRDGDGWSLSDLSSTDAIAADVRRRPALEGAEILLINLGRAKRLSAPDEQLGGRRLIGWDPRASDDAVAWATAGRWRARPADFVVGVGGGRVQVVLKTPPASWRAESGRRFHVDPLVLTQDGARCLRSGDTTPLTAADEAVLACLHEREIAFPRGGRNPVRRLLG